jgi:hypothetical protein
MTISDESIGSCRTCLGTALATLLATASGPLTALPLEIGFATYWRQTNTASRFSPAADGFALIARVTPNPRSDGTLGPGTQVVFEQNGVVVPVPYLDAPAAPDNYGTGIAYDPGLTGLWDVTATNPGTDNPSITVSTIHAIGDQPMIPQVSDMRISGRVSSGMTLDWINPPGSDGTRILINELNQAGTAARLVHLDLLPPGTETYAIPAEFSGSSIGEELKLTAGKTYLVEIQNAVIDDVTGQDLARASSRFEFTASEKVINAYLPVVDPDGRFNFDIAVEPGVAIDIDPFIAVGYDYAIGDPFTDPLFASVSLPSVGDGLYDLLLFNPDGSLSDIVNGLAAGVAFDFTSVDAFDAGITGFGVRGIETGAMLAPDDPTAFVTRLTFTEAGRFTGSMTPIVEFVPVPIPATAGLFMLGLLVLRPKRCLQ